MKTILLSIALLFSSIALAQEKINWMSIEEAEAANKKEPRKVIIDVYTNWCGWCKRMDKDTFQKEKIAKYVNKNFYAVKLNAEQKDSIVFRGYTFKFIANGRRGYHELAATLLNGKMSYPSIVYLDEKLNIIQPIPGYMNATRFEEVINYFAGNHYKNTAFEEFQKYFRAQDKS